MNLTLIYAYVLNILMSIYNYIGLLWVTSHKKRVLFVTFTINI